MFGLVNYIQGNKAEVNVKLTHQEEIFRLLLCEIKIQIVKKCTGFTTTDTLGWCLKVLKLQNHPIRMKLQLKVGQKIFFFNSL